MTHLTPSLFERLRRATSLRALLLVGALMVAQSGIVCLCDSATSAAETAQVAEMQAPDDGSDCCVMCTDCAQCGGCHTSVVSPRADFGPVLNASLTDARIAAATAARAPWTPPAHYRPPIDNA